MKETGSQSVSEQVAANARALREHQEISQAALARAMKDRGFPWHQATVHRVESGRQAVTVDEAVALAGILGVPLERLMRPSGEAAGQMAADQAVARLRQAADDAVDAVARLLFAREAAGAVAREAAESKHPSVRDAGRAVSEEMERATVQNVTAEGTVRWEVLRDGD